MNRIILFPLILIIVLFLPSIAGAVNLRIVPSVKEKIDQNIVVSGDRYIQKIKEFKAVNKLPMRSALVLTLLREKSDHPGAVKEKADARITRFGQELKGILGQSGLSPYDSTVDNFREKHRLEFDTSNVAELDEALLIYLLDQEVAPKKEEVQKMSMALLKDLNQIYLGDEAKKYPISRMAREDQYLNVLIFTDDITIRQEEVKPPAQGQPKDQQKKT